MGTITDKLAYTKKAKLDIKQSINDKGVTVTDVDPLGIYFEKINEITGGGGGGSLAPIATLYDYNAVEGNSITELTCNCNTYKEGKVIAAVVVRSDLTEIPVGWTVIYTTKGLEDTGTLQKLILLLKNSTESTSSITIKCATAGRIYITMLSFYNIFNIKITSPETIASVGTYSIPAKSEDKTKIWFLHKIMWSSNSWTSNNKKSILIQDSSTSPRLCSVIDPYHENRAINITAPGTDDCEILGITLEVKKPPKNNVNAQNYYTEAKYVEGRFLILDKYIKIIGSNNASLIEEVKN